MSYPPTCAAINDPNAASRQGGGRWYRVRELSLFGSAARDEMRPGSDIDLLVEFLPDAEVDLVDHAGLMLDLAELLGRKVDLVSKRALKPLIRDSVLSGARLLYAA